MKKTHWCWSRQNFFYKIDFSGQLERKATFWYPGAVCFQQHTAKVFWKIKRFEKQKPMKYLEYLKYFVIIGENL